MKKLTENQQRHIGESLTIRWGTSRGRDSYGYATCSLRNSRGERVAACNGGGYDMRGTVIGDWVARTFPNELNALKEKEMPEHTQWQRADNPKKICRNDDCTIRDCTRTKSGKLTRYENNVEKCPHCGEELYIDHHDGKLVNEGRYLYGLCFIDPNYDPGKAIITTDEELLGGKAGETVEEREKAGKSIGLERYQAFYRESSKIPTKRHTVPNIDGACGVNSVMDILHAIGLELHQVADTSKLDVYVIQEYKNGRK